MARQRLAAELADRVPAALLADPVAGVGELLGNAVRHAQPLPGGLIRVAWRVGGGPDPSTAGAYVVLRVTDGGSEATPQPRVVGPDSVDGRGLSIVAALAARWGVEREGVGQCVWARVEASAP
jgi:two-component sensor histidine kinase